MWFPPIEWTPAACFVAFQACVTVLVGLILFVPLAFGKTDGFCKAYWQNNAAYDPLIEGNDEDVSLRNLELEIGAHDILWGVATIAALIAAGGGGAQIVCILELAPMFALIYYFFSANKKAYAIVNLVFLLAFFYFGFLPTPTAPSVTWQPATIFLILHSAVTALTSIAFLAGATEKLYESQPLTKTWLSSRDREILMGTQLLGLSVGAVGAILTNGAENFCLLVAPAFIVTGVGHWIGTGDKDNARTNFIIAFIYLCFGIFPRVLQ